MMLKKSSGFTLIEVAIAVLILASALGVLLGMQSSVLSQTINDRKEQQAMLLARRILAALEVSEEILKVGVESSSAKDMLESFNIEVTDPDELKNLADLQATLQVSYSGMPGIDPEQAMKQIILRVYWGPAAADSFEVVYFVPNDENQEEDEEG